MKLSEKIQNKYNPESDIFTLYPPVVCADRDIKFV